MAKRKYGKKISTVRTGELATKERRSQAGGVIAEIIDRDVQGKALIKRHRASAECVLDRYLLRDLLTEAEHEAGIKFRTAYLRAALKIRVIDGNPFFNEYGSGDSDKAAVAGIYSERLLRAAYSVLSPEQRTVVIAVCGHDEHPGSTSKRRTLQRGLEQLIHLWHLDETS